MELKQSLSKSTTFNTLKNFSNSFTVEFCWRLEWALTKAFSESEDDTFSNYWCDGVLHAPFYDDEANYAYLSVEAIDKRKYIDTTAWLGPAGQTSYDMRIRLGMRALAANLEERILSYAIPGKKLHKWVDIYPEDRYIELRLK